jgi:hypothetical protein
MWYSASVYAYDVMDQVCITLVLRSAGGLGAVEEPVELRATTTVSGVGETSPQEWVKDALIALIEAL